MQEDKVGDAGAFGFRGFLRARRLKILVILLLALAVRAGLVAAFPDPPMETRYRPTAVNILEGNGFSTDERAPYTPGEAAAPAYPLFIAAVYALFGRSASVLLLSQAFLDLLTCLLVAFASFNLAPARLKNAAAVWSLTIYGLFSWPTIVWVARVYAETLTLFFTMLAVALCAVAMRKGARYWFGAGLACGLAILTRPDSVLLLGAVALFLLTHLARHRGRAGVVGLFGFCLAVALALAPWVVRNYVSLGKFQPLASEYGCARDCYFPRGYLWWVRTWLKDETYFDVAFDAAWSPGATVDPGQLPREAYDSEEERQRLADLFARYNRARLITPELDREFRSLGNERIRRAPLRFFLLLPLYRSASLWLTGFSTSHPTPYVLILRVLSVLPIHVGGALGLALWGRRQPLAALLVLIVLVRTLFFAYHYAPETRYMAEIYPPMIAACGVTAAAVWSYVSKVWARLIPARRRSPPGERA
jgi:4-amino-4-deoxy-L-arabinose transferase-like glycosyltransferase